MCQILIIPNVWFRYPLWALLIWQSMLNLFISVIPSEGTITLWAGYRINIKLILYVVNNLLQKCSSNLYLSRYNSHCCQCLNPAYILTSFLYVFSVADPLITHALGISYYSGLDFSCIAVTLARGSWLSGFELISHVFPYDSFCFFVFASFTSFCISPTITSKACFPCSICSNLCHMIWNLRVGSFPLLRLPSCKTRYSHDSSSLWYLAFN